MNLEYYNIFYEVALNENITATAKKLNMSQPSISRYIAILEYESNKKLFFRSKTGVKLTPEGHILFDYVSKGIEFIKRAETELEIWKENQPQILTLAVSQLTVKTIIPPILEKLQQKYPNIKVKLTIGASAQAIATLQSGLADIAIIPGPIENDPNLRITELSQHESILIAGIKYKNMQSKPISISDIPNYPFITFSPGTAGRKYINQIFSAFNMTITPEIEVPSSDLIPCLVRNNLGIGIVSEIFAKEDLNEGNVIHIPLKEKLNPRSFLLCTNRLKTLPQAGEMFIKTLLNQR